MHAINCFRVWSRTPFYHNLLDGHCWCLDVPLVEPGQAYFFIFKIDFEDIEQVLAVIFYGFCCRLFPCGCCVHEVV